MNEGQELPADFSKMLSSCCPRQWHLCEERLGGNSPDSLSLPFPGSAAAFTLQLGERLDGWFEDHRLQRAKRLWRLSKDPSWWEAGGFGL